MMWSWVLEGIGVLGSFLIGRKYWWSWIIVLFNLCLWMTYGIVTKQYGFDFFGFFYGIVYTRNLVKWYQQRNESD